MSPAIIMSGEQWNLFIKDDTFWPKDAWVEDEVFTVNGVEHIELDHVHGFNLSVEVKSGLVRIPGSAPDVELVEFARQWLIYSGPKPMQKIYAVSIYTGSYEDRRNWVARCFTDKAAADKFAAEQLELVTRLKKEFDEAEDAWFSNDMTSDEWAEKKNALQDQIVIPHLQLDTMESLLSPLRFVVGEVDLEIA